MHLELLETLVNPYLEITSVRVDTPSLQQESDFLMTRKSHSFYFILYAIISTFCLRIPKTRI